MLNGSSVQKLFTRLIIGIFIDNHCKLILTNYEKQCSIFSYVIEIHECMSECFGICSGLSKSISTEMFLTEDETRTVKNMSKSTYQKKLAWYMMYPAFWQNTKQWDTLMTKKGKVCIALSINSDDSKCEKPKLVATASCHKWAFSQYNWGLSRCNSYAKILIL